MNPDFERYRQELGEARIKAFEALCFHRADEVAQPYAALMKAPLLQATADALVRRVDAEAKGNFDTERLVNALAAALEGPGCMPGLVEARGETGDWFLYSRNINEERGEPFTLDNLLPPVHYGLSSDPEHWFENVGGSETDFLFNYIHVTERGLAFCAWLFPERMEALRKREGA